LKIICGPRGRRWPSILFLLGALFSIEFLPANAKTGAADLNLLLVTIDTLRPDRLSCYSTRYLQTPRIDGIAARGVVFDRAFAHNPMTLPSHVNIMLGMTPLFHGVSENSQSRVADEFLTLAEHLKANGYSTGAFVGAFPLDSRFGLTQGFDVYDDSYPSRHAFEPTPAERKAEKVVESARKWLRGRRGKWFCWVHIWDPHAPYLPPEPFDARYKSDPYSGEVAYSDAELGKLFDEVKAAAEMENTLVIITADHGESLGEHGEMTHSYFAYNSTLWVPLIIAAPGMKASRVKDDVCHVDIFPTVCEILKVRKPSHLQGISLRPLTEGVKAKKRPIYFESLDAYFNRGWAPLRGIIEEGKKFMDTPIPEFYDLGMDFDEKENLAGKRDLTSYLKDLRAVEETFTSSLKGKGAQGADRETRERLKSLGYVASPETRTKARYGPEDDLKTLLPYEQKFYQSILLQDDGKTAESVRLLEEIIQVRKNFGKAYERLSTIYASQGLAEEAINVLELGFRNNPDSYSVVAAYGLALINAGRLDQGIETLGKALSLYGHDPEIWNYLGVAYWKKGNALLALENYRKALDLDNRDAVVHNNLGALFLSMASKSNSLRDGNLAVEHFKKAIDLDPGFSAAYNGLAGAYKFLGKIDEAIASWEKSLRQNPAFEFSILNLGMAYLDKGDKDRALEYFTRYRALKEKTWSPEERRRVESLMDKCKR